MTTTNMFLNFGGKWDSPPLTTNSIIYVMNSSWETQKGLLQFVIGNHFPSERDEKYLH